MYNISLKINIINKCDAYIYIYIYILNVDRKLLYMFVLYILQSLVFRICEVKHNYISTLFP